MSGGMPPLSNFAGIHQGKPILILGGGPSAFDPDLGMSQRMIDLAASEIPIIGLNRAYDVAAHIPINYQLSIDRIWTALLHKKRTNGVAAECWERLQETFAIWRNKYRADDWTLEDFAAAYKDELDIHPEVWRYLRLCSPFVPFIRFSWANNSKQCPYPSVRYLQAKKQAGMPHGKAPGDALVVGGNCAQTAIHLAHVMGGSPIFLLGIDLSDPDPKKRPWEQGARYRYDGMRDPIDIGFRGIHSKIKQQVHVINLNPKSHLKYFEKALTIASGLDRLEKEIKRAYFG